MPKLSVAAAADLIEYFKGQITRVLPHIAARHTRTSKCQEKIVRFMSDGGIKTKRQIQIKVGGEALIFNQVFAAMLKAGMVVVPARDAKIKDGYRLAK